MTLLQIYEIEREVAENPPLPSLTVRRISASVRWWGLCITPEEVFQTATALYERAYSGIRVGMSGLRLRQTRNDAN